MATGSQHHSTKITKLLLLGDSSSGKTGSLISLVRDLKKRLIVFDFDNGIDIVCNEIRETNPELLNNIIYHPLQDAIELNPNKPQKKPKAFELACSLLTHWKLPERTINGIVLPAEDYGSNSSWGPETVIVIDSLSHFAQSVLRYVKYNIPSKRGDLDIYNAQLHITSVLSLLCSAEIACNVIAITHMRKLSRGKDDDDLEEDVTWYPETIGNALCKGIGSYFNSVLLVKGMDKANKGKRFIYTQPEENVCLKNPFPSRMPKKLPIETGLADFFKILQQEPGNNITVSEIQKGEKK